MQPQLKASHDIHGRPSSNKPKPKALPTAFLKEIDPTFVTVVFEDLRTYAAEYHPEDHRMILNMRLSFNKAGGRLGRTQSHDAS